MLSKTIIATFTKRNYPYGFRQNLSEKVLFFADSTCKIFSLTLWAYLQGLDLYRPERSELSQKIPDLFLDDSPGELVGKIKENEELEPAGFIDLLISDREFAPTSENSQESLVWSTLSSYSLHVRQAPVEIDLLSGLRLHKGYYILPKGKYLGIRLRPGWYRWNPTSADSPSFTGTDAITILGYYTVNSSSQF